MPKRGFQPNRFFKQVEKTETCWLWVGPRGPSGGRFGTGGYGRYSGRAAHRASYEYMVGPIPEGLELDHLCQVPRCVNPEHLEPVTHAENMRRHVERKTHCKQGHAFSPEMTVSLAVAIVLAAVGWFTAWCAQDQVTELRKERDKARADATHAVGQLGIALWERDLAETSAHSWRMQAGNLETSLALVLDDRDPLGSSLRLVGGGR